MRYALVRPFVRSGFIRLTDGGRRWFAVSASGLVEGQPVRFERNQSRAWFAGRELTHPRTRLALTLTLAPRLICPHPCLTIHGHSFSLGLSSSSCLHRSKPSNPTRSPWARSANSSVLGSLGTQRRRVRRPRSTAGATPSLARTSLALAHGESRGSTSTPRPTLHLLTLASNPEVHDPAQTSYRQRQRHADPS